MNRHSTSVRHADPASHQESQQWVDTIEKGEGYVVPNEILFRKMLARMPRYAFFRALLRSVQPGDTVLEAGCGWALSSFALAGRGVRVTAVDISLTLIAGLKRLQLKLGSDFAANLTFVRGDIFCLPEVLNVCDVVFSDGTYEHFLRYSDRRDMLRNVRAVLHEHGKFIVAVPNLRNPLFHSVVDLRMPSMHSFSAESLVAELEDNGFDVIETGFSFVNPGYAQWVQSRWMIVPIEIAGLVFPFLPRIVKRYFCAHLYCIAEKTS